MAALLLPPLPARLLRYPAAAAMAPCRLGLGVVGGYKWRGTGRCTALSSLRAGVSVRKSLVFLGTPNVAAAVLRRLVRAAEAEEGAVPFEIKAVVTQPARPKGRGKKVVPSPVAEAAAELGFEEATTDGAPMPDRPILAFPTAKDEALLAYLEAVQPDLCVTAAYGNFLPKRFLAIPKAGTLNVHPSLLPRFRGAAPVQRALEAQEHETGVVVAYTVLKMDSGPVLASHTIDAAPGAVDPATGTPVGDMDAPALLDYLFERGADCLVEELGKEDVWTGAARETRAVPQDDAMACEAPMIAKAEGYLAPAEQTADAIHAQARAFAGWPGCTALMAFVAEDDDVAGASRDDAVEVKVLETRLINIDADCNVPSPGVLAWQPACKAWWLGCAGGGAVEVVRLQNPGKKPVDGAAFRNGHQGEKAVVFSV